LLDRRADPQKKAMPQDLPAALVGLQRDKVVGLIKGGIAAGEDPRAILEECRQGMSLVGERFQAGEYFLAELLLSAEIFKRAVALLEPHLKQDSSPPAGTVVLATMQGDIHDLGKNIFATLLRAHAFEVHDLGVNVAPLLLVEKVKELRPHFVGLSALLTTTFPSMKQVAEMLRDAGLRDELKLLIGGGVTTVALRDHVGADFQTTDAIEGVAYCVRAAGERTAR
jgi:methylmalonyl-CoA mutase cobalamin-binding domain/chain